MRQGDSDDYVKFFQDHLHYMGYAPELDGTFGPQTDAVVRQVQAGYGLADDGVVGPKTWTQIGALIDAYATLMANTTQI